MAAQGQRAEPGRGDREIPRSSKLTVSNRLPPSPQGPSSALPPGPLHAGPVPQPPPAQRRPPPAPGSRIRHFRRARARPRRFPGAEAKARARGVRLPGARREGGPGKGECPLSARRRRHRHRHRHPLPGSSLSPVPRPRRPSRRAPASGSLLALTAADAELHRTVERAAGTALPPSPP